MKMLGMVIIFLNVYSNQGLKQDKKIESFMNTVMVRMVNWEDISAYFHPKYLNDKFILNTVMIDKYKISEINYPYVVTEIDHGKGIYCTKLTFQLTLEGDNYFLIPSKINSEEINGKVINYRDPWEKKDSTCN